jgi:amino acid transporter
VSVAQGFSASWIFLVALGIGLLAMYMQALSLSELATLMPKAGSMNEYVRAGLGAFAGSMTALVGYVAIIVFPAAAESLFPAIIAFALSACATASPGTSGGHHTARAARPGVSER